MSNTPDETPEQRQTRQIAEAAKVLEQANERRAAERTKDESTPAFDADPYGVGDGYPSPPEID